MTHPTVPAPRPPSRRAPVLAPPPPSPRAPVRGITAALLALAALTATLIAAPAQAAPTARITCSTQATRLSNKTWRISVRSNHPDPHRVHSYIAYYRDSDRVYRQVGPFLPYGPTITLGGHYYYRFASWQAGTRCHDYWVPGAV